MGERVDATVRRELVHEPAGWADEVADEVNVRIFTWPSFLVHVVWFALWLALRLDINTLTMVVSLEAIFLCIAIGISQNRQAAKDRKRDDQEASEVDLLYEINRQQLEILEALKMMVEEGRISDRTQELPDAQPTRGRATKRRTA